MQTMRNFGHKAARCAALALMVSFLSSQTALAQGRPEIVWVQSSQHFRALSPDGRWVASIWGYPQNIYIQRSWDLTPVRTIRFWGDKIVFSPNSLLLASASIGVIKVWRLRDGAEIFSVEIPSWSASVEAIDFSPNSTQIAAGLSNGEVRVWDISTGNLRHTLTAPAANYRVTGVDFSPDGSSLAASYTLYQFSQPVDGRLRVWRMPSGSVEFTLSTEPAYSVAYTPDNLSLATGHTGMVRMWDASDGAEWYTLATTEPSLSVFQIDFLFTSDDLLVIAAARISANYYEGVIHTWRESDGGLIRTLPSQRFGLFPRGEWIATEQGIWRMSDGSLVRPYPNGGGRRIAMAGEYVVTSSGVLLQASDGRIIRYFNSEGPGLGNKVAISLESGRVAIGFDWTEAEVHVFALDTGEHLYTIQTNDYWPYYSQGGFLTDLVFSRSGVWLAAFGRNLFGDCEYDPDTGGCNPYQYPVHFAFRCNSSNGDNRTEFPDLPKPQMVRFSRNDSQYAAVGLDGRLTVRAFPSGDLVRELTGHTDEILDLAFSPSGALMASASADRTIRLWNTSNWSLARTLSGHTGAVNAIAFSPDGTLLASAGYDNTIRIWRVSDGALLRTYTEEAHQVTSLGFYNDLLIYAREDGVVIAARERAGRRERLPAVAR